MLKLFSLLLLKVDCLLGCWLSPLILNTPRIWRGIFIVYPEISDGSVQYWENCDYFSCIFPEISPITGLSLPTFQHFFFFFFSRDVYNKWTKSNKLHNSLLLISRSFSTENDYHAVKFCELLWIHYWSAFLWKIRLWWSSQICLFSIKASADWINAAFVLRAGPLVWEQVDMKLNKSSYIWMCGVQTVSWESYWQVL